MLGLEECTTTAQLLWVANYQFGSEYPSADFDKLHPQVGFPLHLPQEISTGAEGLAPLAARPPSSSGPAQFLLLPSSAPPPLGPWSERLHTHPE